MSDLWLIAYERVFEDFDAGVLDIEDVRAELKRLGLDADEIDGHVCALTSEDA
jgi:hypothetical protein